MTKRESEPATRSVKRRKLFHGSTATLLVGDERRSFIVHKQLLCSVSDYFIAALEGNFKEATEQNIEFPDEDPEIIERFLLWVYNGNILEKSETVVGIPYEVLASLYVFAESRCVYQLQNDVIDVLIRKSFTKEEDKILSPDDWFTKVSPSSPLRRLVADVAADGGTLDDPSWEFQEYPKDFLIDLIQALYKVKLTGRVRGFWKIRCNYHIHGEGEPRCSEDASEIQE
ncbi:hypothetical protein MMC30_000682 [Trapelia coarctata]|nr:hypothetical protein [Trapelia coarctata]